MYLRTYYLHTDDNAYQTGVSAEFETPGATRKNFDAARALEVDSIVATFILDLCDENMTILDTIFLDSEGYQQITGEKDLGADYYIEFDREYWDAARSISKAVTP